MRFAFNFCNWHAMAPRLAELSERKTTFLRVANKSRYFARTEFNNCFITATMQGDQKPVMEKDNRP